MLNHAVYFLVGHERAVDARRDRGAWRQVQACRRDRAMIPAPLVGNGAAVDLNCRHLERDARQDVRLDRAGDHVHRPAAAWPGSNGCRPRAPSARAGDQLLDLLADHHHWFGEFVDDDDDERRRVQLARSSGLSWVRDRMIGSIIKPSSYSPSC